MRSNVNCRQIRKETDAFVQPNHDERNDHEFFKFFHGKPS
jgi:hypothetical protein